MKTWITADWHLGESRFEIMGRPFTAQMEMVDTLVNNHNHFVAPNDMVLMVGDVCYQKTPEFLSHIFRFNGKKTLFRGNHDRALTDTKLSEYFERIIPEGEGIYVEFSGVRCYVTHYPTEGVEDAFNLVGHIHSAWKYQLNSLNVGVDVHHFRPVDSERIGFHRAAVEQFYDQDVWVAYNKINAQYQGKRGKQNTYFRP